MNFLVKTRGYVSQFLYSCVYSMSLAISYLLMLIMFIDGWLCVAIVLGKGFGYFLFET